MKVVAQTLKRAAVAAIGVGIFAQPAHAQEYKPYDYYCVESFQVCASVRVYSVGNTLTMEVWNLSGTVGGTHTMTAIGLYHAGAAWTGDYTYNVYYGAGGVYTAENEITGAWKEKRADDISTLAGIDLELQQGTSGNSGITGCGGPYDGGTKWSTCFGGNSSFPGDPRVTFVFNLDSHFSLANVELRWHSQQVGIDGENSLKCDTGGAGDYPPCTAVPEPTTMVLVGTGMAGLGAIARRRRKKLEA